MGGAVAHMDDKAACRGVRSVRHEAVSRPSGARGEAWGMTNARPPVMPSRSHA